MVVSLNDFSGEVERVVAGASPSVVGVGRRGSGVIVAPGLVVTNAHNLHDEVIVSFADGATAEGSVAGADIDGDLAVLSVATGDRPALPWAPEGAEPALGQAVIGLARPGGRGLRAGVGFVSGLGISFRGPQGSTVTGAVEHSAPLPHGSSGGPLLGPEGNLIGINTHREGEGFYLALSAGAELRQRIDALARGETPKRVRLGVALAPPRAARHLRQAVGLAPRDGLLVHEVDDQGPGGRAGIRRGDLIVVVAGKPVTTVAELAEALQQAGESGAAELVVVRGTDEVTLSVSFEVSGPAEQGTA
ncbi:MAG TPA: S1C family serine protease [Acidimicrobiales bacterium]|nr:S1C family serine protease [Acidimicrobiales bacterium]